MKLAWLVLIAPFIYACSSVREIPATPTFVLVVPAGKMQWKREMILGFTMAARQFGLQSEIREYTSGRSESIIKAALEAKNSRRAPICIAFTSALAVAPVRAGLAKRNKTMITIGEDDANSARVGHVGDAPEQLAYVTTIRTEQMKPKPKSILVALGVAPLKKERFIGSLFERSHQWKRFRTRARKLAEITPADLAWADVTLAVGPDAVKWCAQKGQKNVLPVDSSDETISLLGTGAVPLIFAPDYFEMGYRAARIAREYYLEGRLATSAISLPYREVDRELLDYYLKKRYEAPPAIRGLPK